ncbi:MAG: glutathione S-transferase family protein [Deltaproteobacteria bacterium]|nr:glutathione S-transferase family protein [Deltaproteobacteria bacterium]
MIKIYGTKMGSAFRCHVLMIEMGIKYEEVKVDFEKGDQFKPEYLKLNPNGKIPCIVDGDFVLWESMAINKYIATKYNSELLGKTLEENALIDQWSYWAILEVQANLYAIAFQKFWVQEADRDEKAIKKAMDELPKVLKILDNQLEGKEYILGTRFTLADINVASCVMAADFAKYDYSAYKNVSNWIANLNKRPSFAQIPFPPKK